tara:strand:+ start:261 stop:686 length:426 start_codon:yes stop_codon:yes gene_type:complete
MTNDIIALHKCEAYFNLHKRLFSVRDRRNGKVFAHAKTLTLFDAKFVVQPAGRAKVLREKKKNVHAFVRSDSTTHIDVGHEIYWDFSLKKVKYNPYEGNTFTDEEGNPVYESAMVLLGLDKQNKPYILASQGQKLELLNLT